jgi:predicted amidohydrolase YtcJ
MISGMPSAADLLLVNGNVLTMDLVRPRARAVDLKGATLIPGFHDAHNHPHRAALYAIAPGGRVWLKHTSGHMCVANRIGPRLVGGAGALLSGVGLALPAFTIAATGTLPPHKLATGMSAQTMFRQIGAALALALIRRRYVPAAANAGMTSVANSSAERRVSSNVMSPKANSSDT